MRGFTLAELLIALSILGVIATFTIPKVLQSQQDGRYKAIAKEAAETISAAYDAYKLKQAPNASTKPPDLTPFMNYVSVDTSSNMGGAATWAFVTCSVSEPCLRLHNGAVLFPRWMTFNGTGTTNAISFFLDPDGKVSPDVSGRSVMFFLYYNGRLSTLGTIEPNTTDSQTSYNPNPPDDPPWFSWN